MFGDTDYIVKLMLSMTPSQTFKAKVVVIPIPVFIQHNYFPNPQQYPFPGTEKLKILNNRKVRKNDGTEKLKGKTLKFAKDMQMDIQ